MDSCRRIGELPEAAVFHACRWLTRVPPVQDVRNTALGQACRSLTDSRFLQQPNRVWIYIVRIPRQGRSSREVAAFVLPQTPVQHSLVPRPAPHVTCIRAQIASIRFQRCGGRVHAVALLVTSVPLWRSRDMLAPRRTACRYVAGATLAGGKDSSLAAVALEPKTSGAVPSGTSVWYAATGVVGA